MMKGQRKEVQISAEELQRIELDDQQEQNMISHGQVDSNKCQMSKADVQSGADIKSTQILLSQQCKLVNKSSPSINISEMSLKSVVVFLLLLGMILVGVYKIIEQIYEIQHPQLQFQRRIASSRVNMVRQQNSLADDEQTKVRAQTGRQSGQDGNGKKQQEQLLIQQVKKEEEGNYQQQKQMETAHSLYQTNQQAHTQQIAQTYLSDNIVTNDNKLSQKPLSNPPIKPKKQPLDRQKEESTNRQQAESELRQKEQYIQQFEDKVKDDKKQQLTESQSHKDEVGDKTEVLNKEINGNVEKEKEVQAKELFQGKINAENNVDNIAQPTINTVNQQKPIQQQAPVIQPKPPVKNRVPHGKPKQKQSAQSPISHRPATVNPGQSPQSKQQPPKAFVPTAKAGISVQQALKWRSYQQMIQLPLSARADSNRMLLEQYLYYERKYNISQYPQLPICIVVPTFNNVQNSRYQDNLKSILQQNYTNYHVVVIDDKSEDNTGRMINQYIDTLDMKYKEKIKVIINQERKMAMPNLRYAAMNQCKEEELFIIVDGDDLLIGRQVFKLFSAVMQQRNYWVMWTNFLSPKGAIGYSRQYPAVHKQANNYRKAGFVMSHLRAYYTKLFRLIKDEDLKDSNGEFFHAANDVAIGIPILQMAHKHVGYVPQLNYYYNMYTGLNNHKVRLKEQKTNDKLIRKKPKYEALTTLGFGQTAPKIEKMPQQSISPITPMNLKAQNS